MFDSDSKKLDQLRDSSESAVDANVDLDQLTVTNSSNRQLARDDALSPRELERIIHTTYEEIEPPYDLQCRYLLVAMGYLGMRRREVAHSAEAWINWSRGIPEIPEPDLCNKGKFEGECCGYCRKRVKRTRRLT